MAKGSAFVYQKQNSAFQKLHPAARTIYMLCAIATAFCVQNPFILLALFLANLTTAFLAKMSRKMLIVYFAIIGIGAVMIFLTWLPFGKDVGGKTVFHIANFFGYPMDVTDLGLMWASAMGIRILTSSLPIFIYLSSTKPKDISLGLCKIGIPFTGSEMFVLAFRFIPLVQQDASIITEAQRARGLDFSKGGWKDKAHKYSAILAPMIFMSLRRVQIVANALDSKGFRNNEHRHRFYKEQAFVAKDWVVMAITVGLFVFALTARIKLWGVLIPSRL